MKLRNAVIIGERLRALRGERTQAEIAKALGLTANAISQYETGKRIPDDRIKVKIANFFGTSVGAIFFAD